MSFLVVGLAVSDIDVTAVRQIARLTGGEVLICVRNAGIDLIPVLVVRGVRAGVAALPEAFDEGVPLLIVAEVLKSLFLGGRDDPPDVLLEPLLVIALSSLRSSFCCWIRSRSESRRFSGLGFSSVG